MITYCDGCRKEHEDHGWIARVSEGRVIHLCTLHFTPTSHEFIPQRIVEERKQYKKEILQPWRGGDASKEFIEAYPEKAKKIFSKKEIKTARKVWDQ